MDYSDSAGSSKNKTVLILRSRWYFLLLPLFFASHGLYENLGLIPPYELLILFGVLCVISLTIYWIFRGVFRSGEKSALFTFLVMLVSLFFGVIQDFAEHRLPNSFFSTLTFISLFCFSLLAISFFVIRARKKNLTRISFYLNLLLGLYILIDLVGIFYAIGKNKVDDSSNVYQPLKLPVCDTCSKPPVYLVLLDEYSGIYSLKEYFNYDNTGFEDSLRQLGFHVVSESTSNYYYTVYSMASTLNVDYIQGFTGHGQKDDEGYHRALTMIQNNTVVHHFIDEGYTIRNFSYFDLPGFPARYKNDYLPGRINLILSKTVYVRILAQLSKKMGADWPIVFATGDWEEQYIKNNQDMMRQVLNDDTGKIPAFTYIHLMMPHEPFSFNSKGIRMRKRVRATSRSFEEVDHAYLQYLIYTNTQVYKFLSQLKAKTNGKAVILLMSDHGYRGFERKGNMNLLYSNLNAVYLPGMNYDGWKAGTSNVNQFRILFSTLFHANIPLLRNQLIR